MTLTKPPLLFPNIPNKYLMYPLLMLIIGECPLAYVPGIDTGKTSEIGAGKVFTPDTLSGTFNCGSKFV